MIHETDDYKQTTGFLLIFSDRTKRVRHSQGYTIENRGYLFVYIYAWTYVCHFVL